MTLYDSGGERAGALGTIVDITPRIEAERALERERRQLAEAQRTASVGSWRWDRDSGLIEWSEQNFHNHGFEPASEAPPRVDFIAAVHPDDRDAVLELMRARQEEREFITSYRVVHPDGSVHELELRGALERSGRALAGTSRDITAEREAERLKDEFFNLISHELRTPLTSIIGYTELLAEVEGESLSDEGRKFLEVIERNSRRELGLVGDLLMLTRIEAGTFRVEHGEADLDQIVADAVTDATPGAERGEVELVVEAAETPLIVGDPHRLGQVVANLVSNAVKFTPAGGTVRLSLVPVGTRGRAARGCRHRDRDPRVRAAPALRPHVPGPRGGAPPHPGDRARADDREGDRRRARRIDRGLQPGGGGGDVHGRAPCRRRGRP